MLMFTIPYARQDAQTKHVVQEPGEYAPRPNPAPWLDSVYFGFRCGGAKDVYVTWNRWVGCVWLVSAPAPTTQTHQAAVEDSPQLMKEMVVTVALGATKSTVQNDPA